ncbi:MAG: hypothetical protein NTNFB02_11650 [Nitrospira sp.]
MEEGHSCRMGNRRTHNGPRDHAIILQNAPQTVKPRSAAVSVDSSDEFRSRRSPVSVKMMVGKATDPPVLGA